MWGRRPFDRSLERRRERSRSDGMGVEEVKTEDMAAEKIVFGEDAKFS